MKSLLVDALRQAHNSRQSRSLSDSGSFETTSAEFETTANDPVASEVAPSPDELALFETTANAALNDDALYDEPSPDADFDEPLGSKHTSAAQNVLSTSGLSQSGLPAVARFAPVICVMAALITAVSWGLFRSSELGRDDLTMLGLQAPETSIETRQNRPSAINTAAVRFPFLDAVKQAENPENTE